MSFRDSAHLEDDDFVMGGIIRPGAAEADDAVARGDQTLVAAPIENKCAKLVAVGQVRHGQRA